DGGPGFYERPRERRAGEGHPGTLARAPVVGRSGAGMPGRVPSTHVARSRRNSPMLDGRWRAKAEEGLEPVGRALHRLGVSADALTLFGLAAAVGTAFLIANGNLALAVVGLVLSGLPDVLDGSVARQSGTAGERGAFFDSVCDR